MIRSNSNMSFIPSRMIPFRSLDSEFDFH
jgi:hypothetical protein